MSEYLWQLVLADVLFLALAATMGIWFRHWLRRADEDVDRRLRLLESQRARLERLADQLQDLCRRLDHGPAQRGGGPVVGPPEGAARPRGPDERYAQAWRLVDEGLPAAEVARRLELGLAEVELMVRIQRYRSRS